MIKQCYFFFHLILHVIMFSRNYRRDKVRGKDISIVGNANVFDGIEKIGLDGDVVLMNEGPSKFSFSSFIHITELPSDKQTAIDFIRSNMQSDCYRILRPNSRLQIEMTSVTADFVVWPELRINPNLSQGLLKALIRLCLYLRIVPYYRSSLSFVVFWCKIRGYSSIKLYNFDPYNRSKKHLKAHPTATLRDNYNVYIWLNELKETGVIEFEKDSSCLF